MGQGGRVDLATWRRLPAMTVLQRRPVVLAAVLAALPALGFAMLTAAGPASVVGVGTWPRGGEGGRRFAHGEGARRVGGGRVLGVDLVVRAEG